LIAYSFQNKVALITGAGVGIGYEIAGQLARAGAQIILNDIDEALAKQAAKDIAATGGSCTAVGGDAGEPQTIAKMIDTAYEQYGRLDYAIANAGITTFGNFLDYTEADFQTLLKVNLQGSFFLAQKAAKKMIDQQQKGRILLMSSVTGFTFHPDLTAYGMSKAALAFLAKTLGVELGKHQITVNAIAPGATNTNRTADLEQGNYVETWKKITPNGRCATTQDIAHAALFLLSEEAQHITGQTLVVDGGWTSTSPPP
jgi:3-oxoacyl-[acyl-carrier protein] reductase